MVDVPGQVLLVAGVILVSLGFTVAFNRRQLKKSTAGILRTLVPNGTLHATREVTRALQTRNTGPIALIVIGSLLLASFTAPIPANAYVNIVGGGPSFVRCLDLPAIPCWVPSNSGAVSSTNSTLCTSGTGTGCANACDGVFRINYGRCEQGTNAVITIGANDSQNSPTIFPTAFTNVPFVTITEVGINTVFRETEEILYANNGTVTGGTCIGCATFTFSTSLAPLFSGHTVQASYNPGNGVAVFEPSKVELQIDIVSVSGAHTGTILYAQGFDPFLDQVDCASSAWETLGTTANTPGFTNTAITATYHVSTVVALNSTLWSDVTNGVSNGCNTDFKLRVVGLTGTGTPIIRVAKLSIVFFFLVPANQIALFSVSTTQFVAAAVGPPNSITFDWEAFSPAG